MSAAPGIYVPPTKSQTSRGVKIAVRIVGALVVLVAGALFLVQRHSQPATVSNDIPGTTMSISYLDGNIQSQIMRSGPSGFGVTGVKSVNCNPPTSWAPTKTFTCYVYGTGGPEIGQYDATILPSTASGQTQWNGTYTPVG